MIKGKAGSGTRTLLRKIALEWTKIVLNQTEDRTLTNEEISMRKCLKQYKFLIFLSLKLVKTPVTLAQLICSQNPYLTEKDSNDLIEYIEKDPNSVLFMCQGYEEYDTEACPELTAVLQNDKHLNWCVLLTIRPWYMTEVKNINYIDTYVEHLGLSRKGVKQLVAEYTEDFPEKELSSRILNFAKEQNLWDLMSYPLISQFICILARKNESLPHSLTTLHTEIVSYVIKAKLNYKKNNVMEEHQELLMDIGKIAFDTLILNSKELTLKEVKQKVSNDAWNLGFIAGEENLEDADKNEVNFICPSIMEYMAAYFLTNSDNKSTLLEETLRKCSGLKVVYDVQGFFQFVCGLCHVTGNKLLNHVNETAKESQYCQSDLNRMGPVIKSYFEPNYYEYIHRHSDFLLACSKEFQYVDKVDFAVTALSMWLNLNSAGLICSLFSKPQNVKDMELLCLCDTTDIDSTYSPVPVKMKADKVRDYLAIVSSNFHTFALSGVDCAEGLSEVAQQLTNKDNMKTLCLVNANLKKEHVKELSTTFGITCPSLEYINFSGNAIKSTGNDLSGLLQFCPDLLGLSLNNAGLTEEDVGAICECLSQNCRHIKFLDLSNNAVKNACNDLCDILPDLSKLECLKMQHCQIPSVCFPKLTDNLTGCPSLQDLDISWNLIADKEVNIVLERTDNLKQLKSLNMLSQPVSKTTVNNVVSHVKQELPDLKFHLSCSLITARKHRKSSSSSYVDLTALDKELDPVSEENAELEKPDVSFNRSVSINR